MDRNDPLIIMHCLTSNLIGWIYSGSIRGLWGCRGPVRLSGANGGVRADCWDLGRQDGVLKLKKVRCSFVGQDRMSTPNFIEFGALWFFPVRWTRVAGTPCKLPNTYSSVPNNRVYQIIVFKGYSQLTCQRVEPNNRVERIFPTLG